MINVNGSSTAAVNFQSSPSDVRVNSLSTAQVVQLADSSPQLKKAEVDISKAELTQAIETINQAIMPRSLSFREDESSGRSVITVVDKTNDEVIRQIPSEEVLKVSRDIKRLQDEMMKTVGVLIDSKV